MEEGKGKMEKSRIRGTVLLTEHFSIFPLPFSLTSGRQVQRPLVSPATHFWPVPVSFVTRSSGNVPLFID